jgi:zinc-ribbon domain
MQCPRCQAENRAGCRFCAECGAPLALCPARPASACRIGVERSGDDL